MKDNNEIRNGKYRKIARILLIVGIVLLLTGIGLLVFCICTERMRLFPLPRFLMFFGSSFLRFGIIGPRGRFSASVSAPIHKDYVNYRREETADSAKEYYKDVAQGIRKGWQEETKACPKCGKQNPKDAKFCNACGAEFPETVKCPYCQSENAKDSKFCNHCGKRI